MHRKQFPFDVKESMQTKKTSLLLVKNNNIIKLIVDINIFICNQVVNL